MLSFLGENITCSRRSEMCDWVCACLKVAVTKCNAAVTQRPMWMKMVLDSAKRCGAHTLVCCFRVFGLSSILCSSSLVSDKVGLQPANCFAFCHTLVYPKCYLSVNKRANSAKHGTEKKNDRHKRPMFSAVCSLVNYVPTSPVKRTSAILVLLLLFFVLAQSLNFGLPDCFL